MHCTETECKDMDMIRMIYDKVLGHEQDAYELRQCVRIWT